MNTKSRINICAACALSLVLSAAASCNPADNEKGAGKAPTTPTEKAEITFTTIKDNAVYTLTGTDSLFGMDHDAVFAAKASLIIPENICGKDIKPLRTAIAKAAFGQAAGSTPAEALKQHIKTTIGELGYSTEESESADTDDYDGFLSVTGNVASLSPRILSYAVTTYLYPPHAANGETTLSYVNYNLADGKVMGLNDIFTPDGLKSLPAVISGRVKADKSGAGITSLPATGSYYIDYEGRLIFVYQQGEVSYRAAGAVTAAFYPQELEQYMTPAGKSFLIP